MSGCACAHGTGSQALHGSFTGKSADGKPVTLEFQEHERAFQGEGTIGGEKVMLAGAVGWRGTATIVTEGGEASLVALELSPDGEQLSMTANGAKALTLTRGGEAPPETPLGPFSGEFRATKDSAKLGEATFVQHGVLITGVATVAGDAAGITARTTSAKSAKGLATFLDGTQVSFELTLASDEQSIELRGFGQPTRLDRRSGP